MRPDHRARAPPQRPVAPIRCRRLVQAIAARGQRRRPVVPAEPLLRGAKATGCTARRTSLTSKHADENGQYDARACRRSARATHPDRSNSRRRTLRHPNDRHDQRTPTPRASIYRQRTSHQASRPAHHATRTGDRAATTTPSAAVRRHSFRLVDAIAMRGPLIVHLVQTTRREDPSTNPARRGEATLRPTHPTTPQQ
jgi:hypothetical protein